VSFNQNLLRCFILIFFFLLITLSWQIQADAGQLQLAWTDNANNEDGFKIERKTGTTGTYTQVATVGPNVTSYSDFSLADGATYCYRVRAFNSVGNSAYTLEECAAARSMQISRTDIAVYRNGIWYVLRSSDGVQTAVAWGGAPQDIPLN
jgi:Fibronectin type III domain.